MHAIDAVRIVKEALERSDIIDAYREAELIVSHSLGIDRSLVYRDNAEIKESVMLTINEMMNRRVSREPLQYILGYVDFSGLKIRVGRGVLIPRPETELLAEEAIRIIPNIKNDKLKILDLCTGSGCLALAIAKAFPDSLVYGTDSEEAAVKYAEENAKANNIENVLFLKGSLFEPVKRFLSVNGELPLFDLIISNPPYISRNDLKKLQPEIKNWEPVSALDGGEDGLDYYRVIIPGTKKYLSSQGVVLLELGIYQAEAVKHMAEDAGFQNVSVINDYAGIGRILLVQKG